MQIIIDTILGRYKNFILLAFILIAIFFGFQSMNLKLDASSDTLVLENDKDLIKAREVSETYSTNEFLVITLTDDKGIISKENLNFIKQLDLSLIHI